MAGRASVQKLNSVQRKSPAEAGLFYADCTLLTRIRDGRIWRTAGLGNLARSLIASVAATSLRVGAARRTSGAARSCRCRIGAGHAAGRRRYAALNRNSVARPNCHNSVAFGFGPMRRRWRPAKLLRPTFKRRLERAFAEFGLQAKDYCVFLPRLDRQRFLAAVEYSDVVLDSIGWTGCNSSLESLPFDLPIVTLTGPLMRGRHSTAILKMMDVTETIAETVDDYVSIAIRLALNIQWRMAVRRRIADNKHRIYRDRSCVAALGDFLNHVARNEVWPY